ncbi:unannotated protein [freshwater metagenome]|uniref:Unannotated protein n=1 Tax=freshwater metagenome TaxID=449393 RepID=A0A6J7LPC5_9ZZZZ
MVRHKRYEGDWHPHRFRLGQAMRTRLKLLTVGLVLVTASTAGCSSTAGSSGAVQDDATAAAASSAASTAPAPSPDPVAPTVGPTEAPASPVASPTASPPLLGGSNNPNCNTGLQYSCGQIGPGGGTVFYAVSQAFSLSNGYTAACGNNNCHYMEAQTAQLPPMAWCVGSGATTSISPGTGAAIGTGYSNTQTMATFSGYCSSGAANAAVASTSGGYTDWYVPSQDEATPFFDFLRYNSWPANNCWTSSQSSAKNATYFAVQGSFQQANLVKTNNKTSVCLVRAF